MRSESEKRCSRCGETQPLDAYAVRRASPDGRQSTCRACAADYARTTRPRKLAKAPQVASGRKWCRRCEAVKRLDDFPLHGGMADGRQTYCRECFAEIYRERREREGHVVRPANVPDDHKFCRGCQQVKPLSEWAPRRATKDGYAFRCRECMSRRDRARHLAASYGLDQHEVVALLESQHGLCAVCVQRPAIHVDHDHTTGAVRGMLCFRCNAGLGQFRDDVGLLARAAEYLQGRKMSIREREPGVFRLAYPETAPAATLAPRGTDGREAVGIGPLLAKARGA